MIELTKKEENLLRKLALPPKCMHNPIEMIERENHWQCGECGLIAKKICGELAFIILNSKFGKNLVDAQEPLGQEFATIYNENKFDLY